MSNYSWESNVHNVCGGCPHADDNARCLVSGLHHTNARVTFVFDYPSRGEAAARYPGVGRELNLLADIRGRAIQRVLHQLKQQGVDTYIEPDAYGVLFLTGYPKDKGDPYRTAFDTCKPYWRTRLSAMRNDYEYKHPEDKDVTHVLVTFGTKPAQFLLKSREKFARLVDQPHQVTIDGHDYTVVPALSLRALMAEPAKSVLMLETLYKAYSIAYDVERRVAFSPADLLSKYTLPTTDEELLKLTDEIIGYSGNPETIAAKDWAIAIDCETTSLVPHNTEDRVLMISVAWAEGKSTAIALDHPDRPYSYQVAYDCIKRILGSDKPKVFHNAKFEYRWLSLHPRYQFTMRNVSYDTLLGAHFLNEALQGEFDLGALTRRYAPSYGDYKSMIQTALKKQVRDAIVARAGHAQPDYAQSTQLSAFFPEADYIPASEDPATQAMLTPEDHRKLWDLELAYLKAFTAGDKSSVSKIRTRVTRILKAYSIPYPNTAKVRDYAAEIEDTNYGDVPYNVLAAYAAVDTDVTRQIFVAQHKAAHFETRKLPERPQGTRPQLVSVMSNLYVPSALALGRAEYHGTLIDQNLLDRYRTEIGDMKQLYLDKLQYLVADDTYNPNSSDETERILTDVFPLNDEDRQMNAAQDSMSIRKDWLADMEKKYAPIKDDSTANRNLYRFVAALRRYRAAAKAYDGFLNTIERLMTKHGRIHTSFSPNGTRTGRLASSSPNLQNIPKYMCSFAAYDGGDAQKGWNIKDLFIPDVGMAWWQLDISAAEIRVLCAYARDEELIKALCDGLDIHSFTAASVAGIPYDEFVARRDAGDAALDLQRTSIKRVVFGTLYGAGDTKIAEQIFGTLSTDELEAQRQVAFAASTRKAVFARFPKVGEYVNSTQNEAMTQGYVETLFGRRRRFPLSNADRTLMSKARREAVNFKVQSTASDLVISQLVEVSHNLGDIGATLQLTVHDSMCGSIDPRHVFELKDFFDKYIVERVAEKFPWLPVPFKYDADVGHSYGSTVKLEDIYATEQALRDSVRGGSDKAIASMTKTLAARQALYDKYSLQDYRQ